MPTLKTQEDVFKLPLPKLKPGKCEAEAVYFDEGKPRDRVTGLALRVRLGGSRSWVYFYRWGGRLQKLTIGSASVYTLDQARKGARAQRTLIDQEKNPQVEKRAKLERQDHPVTFGEAVEVYLTTRSPDSPYEARRMRPRSYAEACRHLRVQWKPLHKHGLRTITRGHVTDRHEELIKLSGPVAADRAKSTLSAFFVWAGTKYKDIAANPVAGTPKASADKPRERTLTDEELAAVWAACPDNDYGRVVRLLMLTGQRRDEIGGLRWAEITGEGDETEIRLPSDRTKNKQAHTVPLGAMARQVLEGAPKVRGKETLFGRGDRGYSGWSKSKAALDAGSKIAPWTLHDLRRTTRTRLGRLGVLPHVSEAIMNHLPPKLIRTYDTNTYEDKKREGLELWGSQVKIAIAKAGGANVVKLKKA